MGVDFDVDGRIAFTLDLVSARGIVTFVFSGVEFGAVRGLAVGLDSCLEFGIMSGFFFSMVPLATVSEVRFSRSVCSSFVLLS